MKKLFTTVEYKSWHRRKLKSESKRSRKRKRKPFRGYTQENISRRDWRSDRQLRRHSFDLRDKNISAFAPSDFRLFSNPEECLEFFRLVRSPHNVSQSRNYKFVRISLQNIDQIDYGTISVLTAISDQLKLKGITLQGDFPKNPTCKAFLNESGFLNHMYDEKNRKFPKTEASDLIFFEKGHGILSVDDNMKISALVKNVVAYLTGELHHFLPVKTILLEICGNSIEHAYPDDNRQQWLLGVKYDNNKVIFTVTDVGKGILETLYRKFRRQFSDFFKGRTNLDILSRAFDQKYGSSTQEINRNKGLPAIKANVKLGTIQSLKVVTNNVFLDFNEDGLSRVFDNGAPRFRGTIYQWEMNKECISKAKKEIE